MFNFFGGGGCNCYRPQCNRCSRPCGCEPREECCEPQPQPCDPQPCCPRQCGQTCCPRQCCHRQCGQTCCKPQCDCPPPRPCCPPMPPVPPFPPFPPMPPRPPMPPLPPVPPAPPALTSPVTVMVGGGAAVGLTTDASGTASNAQYIGFGSSAIGAAYASPVALPPSTAALAYTVPAGGRITAFSASYLPAATPTGLTDGTVYAALMADFSGNGSFALVPGSTLAVARGITAATAAGTPYSATKAINAPIGAATRLITVFYLANAGGTAAGTLLGYAGASYTIDPRMR